MVGHAGAVTMDWSGWFPAGVDWREEEARVLWFRLGDYRFDDAYFSDTVARCARHPLNLAFARQTTLDVLEDAASTVRSPRISGIIFHLSRCGSTLISKSLAAIPNTLVISEAPPMDAIVRLRQRNAAVSEDQQVRWLRALTALFAAAHGPHDAYVIKTDAWHALDIPLFERAFPGVPWIFVYRDPVEILVSHAARMSYMMSFVNAPDFIGVDLAAAARIPRSEYHARVLGRIAGFVAEYLSDGEALVRYDELPAAIEERIAPRIGIQLGEAGRDAIRRSARYDAKRPGRLFESDSAAKQQAADMVLRSAAERFVVPEIQHLDVLAGRR